MIKIDHALLSVMAENSRNAKRKRAHHIFHKASDDVLQRFLNAMQPGTYLQPHKHEDPDKREVFIALTGRFAVIEFDPAGRITDHIILDPKTRDYAAEVAPRTFHTVICIEPDSIAYELKDGPYNPIDDKNFASWAPKEGESGCDAFLNKILTELNLKISR
jgi:cupin fold WbuC family metalloprotein